MEVVVIQSLAYVIRDIVLCFIIHKQLYIIDIVTMMAVMIGAIS